MTEGRITCEVCGATKTIKKIDYTYIGYEAWQKKCEDQKKELKDFEEWINWFMGSDIYHWIFKHHWLMVHDSTVKDLMADLHQATKGPSYVDRKIKAFERDYKL